MAAHYGVTVEDLNPIITGQTITAATKPNVAQVESWIARHAGIVDGVFQSVGLDPDGLEVDGPGYSYGAEIVFQKVGAQVILASGGRFDIADLYRKEAKEQLKQLLTLIAVVGDDAPSEEGDVTLLISSSTPTMLDRIAAKPQSLRTQFVRNNQL